MQHLRRPAGRGLFAGKHRFAAVFRVKPPEKSVVYVSGHTAAPPPVRLAPQMIAPYTPKQNRLLAALPGADYDRLLPHLEHVPLELGWALYESGGQQGYVYFPTASIVSLLYVMEDGSS